jgi:hypothetical protein
VVSFAPAIALQEQHERCLKIGITAQAFTDALLNFIPEWKVNRLEQCSSGATEKKMQSKRINRTGDSVNVDLKCPFSHTAACLRAREQAPPRIGCVPQKPGGFSLPEVHERDQ